LACSYLELVECLNWTIEIVLPKHVLNGVIFQADFENNII